MLVARKTFHRRAQELGFCVGGLLLAGATPLAHDPVPKATWIRDVAPLFKRYCESCHGAGGAATPPLTTLDEVVAVKDRVKRAILERRMPVWGAARGFGAFRHDPSLSPQQIAIVAAWVEAGTPRGTIAPVRLQPVHVSTPHWRSATKVQLMLEPFTPGAAVVRQIIRLPVSGPTMITAWQLEPGDPTMRHVEFREAKSTRLLWTWSAGMSGEELPRPTAYRLRDRVLSIELTRRTVNSDGTSRPPKRVASVLSLWISHRGAAPLSQIAVECGQTAEFRGTLYAIRSVAGAPAIAIEDPLRPLARLSSTLLPITYWLRDPVRMSTGGVTVTGERCGAGLLFTGSARIRSSH
jgi:hypothetical protein